MSRRRGSIRLLEIERPEQAGGSFLAESNSTSPETRCYHELVVLHAAASYAVQAEDRTVASAVRRATLYHLHQTQPDHAAGQPSGLFALIWPGDGGPDALCSRPWARMRFH